MSSKILQIRSDTCTDQFHQLKIIENKGGGDCLFLTLRYFLRNSTFKFNNIPKNSTELRLQAVDYILRRNSRGFRLNFDRFRDTLIFNLQQHIPNISNYGKNSKEDADIRKSYRAHMSKPGNCGTFTELCAIAEMFGFSGYLFRRDNSEEYICHEFGLTGNENENETRPKAILLFTGPIGDGHFRLLDPTDPEKFPTLMPGKYNKNESRSSTKPQHVTSIERAVLNITEESTERGDTQAEGGFNCDVCGQPFPTKRGMKVHRNVHTRKSNETTTTQKDTTETNCTTTTVPFDDFINLIARCKNNIKILKRIPRGARVSAANGLAKCIELCVSQPKVEEHWQKLLTFAYSALRVPLDQSKRLSLTSLVKKNIDKRKLENPKSTHKNTAISLSKKVEAKIADGDIRGAVKLLSSVETLAKQDICTLEALKAKHPPPVNASFVPEPPDTNISPLQVTEREVYFSITRFPNGSSSGIDGILPEHLKELTSPATGEAGLRLLRAITDFTNISLTGKMEDRYSKVFYGASLCALDKKEGGIRPIAVGNTFRRLTAKLACGSIRSEIGSKFQPRQVGFGTRNGCEAAAHATRTFIKRNRRSEKVVLKIDFRNAFNEVDRSKFLREVKSNTPSIYPFILQCYSSSTFLFFGEDIILSQNGAQQGDPCAPLLFCFAIESVISELNSEFEVFYLDDGTIGGEANTVLDDFRMIIRECKKFGLNINTSKCELFFCSETVTNVIAQFDEVSPGIAIVEHLTLLGAPISESSTKIVWKKKLEELKFLFERLTSLDSHHISFFILKNCFALPKLTYFLRTTPLWNHQDLIEDIDSCIESTLQTLTNCQLDTQQRILSSLPIRCGGLGIRRVKDVFLPAFLSSINASYEIITLMLRSPELEISEIADYNEALLQWNRSQTELPVIPSSQKSWDQMTVERHLGQMEFNSDTEKARFLAIQRPESSAWLHSLPSKEIGTLLNNNVFRISVGLRLGCDICKPHRCNCGVMVDCKGRHGLKCKKSAGRSSRHAELNAIIKRGLASADINAKLEPVGLCREDGKRVDGVTIIPWSKGRHLIWDATCTDTFSLMNLKTCTNKAGNGAINAAKRKTTKYESLTRQNYEFIPFAVETMGPWCTEAIQFINKLGHMISLKNCEPRSTFYLKQRISIAIQRGNASSIMGSIFKSTDEEDELDMF